MRRLVSIVVFAALFWPAFVHADARAEMAAALEAQADTKPAPASLPVTLPAAPRAASTPMKPVTPRAPVDASSRAAGRIQQLLVGLSTALARQTQAAAQQAAGQAQAQSAKDRATRNPRN